MTSSDALSLPSSLSSIEQACRWAAGHLRSEGFDAERVWEVELALTEALSNVIRHAYGGDEEQRIELRLSVDAEQLQLCVRDFGAAFDEAAYVPPDLDAAPAGGYGLLLLEQLVDEVRRERPAGGGTALSLVKYRPGSQHG